MDIIIPLVAFAVGLLVKFIDLEEHGLKLSKVIFYSAAVAAGALTAVDIKLYPVLFNLAFGIVLGLIMTGKIDTKAHTMALFTFLAAVFVWAQPEISYLFLLVIVAASGADEVVNNRVLDKGRIRNGIARKFLEVRPVVEIAVFCISAFTGIWAMWLTIFSFDVGYVLVSKFAHVK